jgi:hypothetical protein
MSNSSHRWHLVRALWPPRSSVGGECSQMNPVCFPPNSETNHNLREWVPIDISGCIFRHYHIQGLDSATVACRYAGLVFLKIPWLHGHEAGYYIKLGQVIARSPVTLPELAKNDWMQHVGYRTLLEASQADMCSFVARA